MAALVEREEEEKKYARDRLPKDIYCVNTCLVLASLVRRHKNLCMHPAPTKIKGDAREI